MFKEVESFFKNVVNYCKVYCDELVYKATWPTGQELTHSAVVVLSASLVIALIMFCMDWCFQYSIGITYPG